MFKKWYILALVCVGLACMLNWDFNVQAQATVLWPTSGWETSTPEAQGMNSQKLADLWNRLQKASGPGSLNIHGLMIVRHGKVVMDASVMPYDTNQPHELFSTTKSVLSLVVGIAMDQGYIDSVDQSIWDFFPKSQIANMDARKEAITLRHLLTHKTGNLVDEEKLLTGDTDGKTFVQFILDSEMAFEPGKFFEYKNANTYLVSAIIQQTTGMTTLEFAQKNLFEPLGIQNASWATDPQGITLGGRGLALSLSDLAKLGYLTLHQGQWDGQQIVSSEWVATSLDNQIAPMIPHFWEGYGYYWYNGPIGYWRGEPKGADAPYRGYAAMGFGGQFMIVIPDLDLIMVGTGDYNYASIYSGITREIIPSIEAEIGLPENSQAFTELQMAISLTQKPAPETVAPMTESEKQIERQIFALEANDYHWKTLSIDFAETEATLTLECADGAHILLIGLDNLFRTSDSGMPLAARFDLHPNAPMAMKGAWTAEQTFEIEFWDMLGTNGFLLTLRFDKLTARLQPILEPSQAVTLDLIPEPIPTGWKWCQFGTEC